MRTRKDAAFAAQRGLLSNKSQHKPFLEYIKGTKRLMASIVAWLVGFLFLGLGAWILLLRSEGLIDRIWPHNMLIGQMAIDGKESKGHAELMRARFDHHFRRPVTIAKETGFFEVLTLDTPELFQQKDIDASLKNVTVEVGGVNVSLLIRVVNQLAQPDRWVIEGDFQVKSDRVLLALRMRRGQRLIRTWYLERIGDTVKEKSKLLDQLIDDAIFQLAYDFGNKAEQDEDLKKWQDLLPAPVDFPSREAVAAYYEGRGALARYYAYGEWRDLDLAVERLRTLRSQMPEYANGLKLLGMALAEQRNEPEAIHVYEQLELLLLPDGKEIDDLDIQEKRRYLPIMLLEATATAKLYTWQAAHEAIRKLLELNNALDLVLADISQGKRDACDSGNALAKHERLSGKELAAIENYAAFHELRAQTATQLAYVYALYLSYIQHHAVHEMFANSDAPGELQVADSTKRDILKDGPPEKAKPIVRKIMREIKNQHETWIHVAEQEQDTLEQYWCVLPDAERRQAELIARLNLSAGYAQYRIAELEDASADESAAVLGATYDTRLKKAAEYLRKAEAAHPNHYLVLQYLGLVYAEPRGDVRDLSIAEQYIERAILAKQADYFSHALLARILLRRVANSGLDLMSRDILERGLAEIRAAIKHREYSGSSQLLRAQYLTMLLEIERDETKRQELRVELDQSIRQANRFLPVVFDNPNVDLSWLKIVEQARQLGLDAEKLKPSEGQGEDVEQQKRRQYAESKDIVVAEIKKLIETCDLLERRWVARQRVYLIDKLEQRAEALLTEIEKSTLDNWRDIKIQIL